MWVYIDDSGDAGMKIGQGSSSHLVMAAVVFRQPEEIQKLATALAQSKQRTGHKGELKFNKTTNAVKRDFLPATLIADYSIRTIIIDKARLHSPKLRAEPCALKSYAVRMLLTKNYGEIRDAKIFIDGQDTRGMGIPDTQYLMRMVNRETPGTISGVRFVDSRENEGIQLADMVAGSILRAVRTDRATPDATYWELVRHRSWQPRGSYWMFCR